MSLILIISMFMLTSCAEFLDKKDYTPLSTVPEKVPSKEGHFDDMKKLEGQKALVTQITQGEKDEFPKAAPSALKSDAKET